MPTPITSDKPKYKTPLSTLSMRPDAFRRVSKKAERCRITKMRMGDLIADILDRTKDADLKKLDETLPMPRRKKAVRSTGGVA